MFICVKNELGKEKLKTTITFFVWKVSYYSK